MAKITKRTRLTAAGFIALGIAASFNRLPTNSRLTRAGEVIAARPQANSTVRPTGHQIRLGQLLFEDVRLSRDSTVSCATCHMPSRAFSEPRQVSHGIGSRARKRNAPSLLNVSLGRIEFDWDGRATSLDDQLRGVFAASGDMGHGLADVVARVRSDSTYDSAFRRAYGRSPDVPNVLDALVAFQNSLVVAGSRFDKFYIGGDSMALSASERRGWFLFGTQNLCAGCHSPVPTMTESQVIQFTDGRFHNLGVGYQQGRMADVGRYAVTQNPDDWGKFMTPSLRNVALTAPYMHDGSLATLEDVVAFYADGGNRNPNRDVVIGPLNLTKQDKDDLVAFMRTLTTEWLTDSLEVRKRFFQH